MMMRPLYPCGKPCSRETLNETVKRLALLSYDGITASNLNPVEVISIIQSNRKFYHIYTITIVYNSQISQSDWYFRNCQVWA